VLLAFNNQNEWNFAFSTSWRIGVSMLLNNLLLCSFQISQTQRSQINCKNNLRAFEWPVKCVNWCKWSLILWGSALDTPIQHLIYCHKEPKTSQWRNRWDADSALPHPDTHIVSAAWRRPHLWRLILVGNLSFSKRQMTMEAFNWTYLCQTRSFVASTVWDTEDVRIWYAPLTV